MQRTLSPIDGRVVVERNLHSLGEAQGLASAARRAQALWAQVSVEARCEVVARAERWFERHSPVLAEEITLQMGRPSRDAPDEIAGLLERCAFMREIAPGQLAEHRPSHSPGLRRFIRREPLGVVLILAPWNYPYLTAVNALIPALLAGNAVILKHSDQTPLCGERLAEGLRAAGLPEGLCQVLYMDHGGLGQFIGGACVDYVAFTGSVEGGTAVCRAAAESRLAVGLELGGKDAAYVRADADLPRAAAGLVSGAFYNAGQSCCAIERIFVEEGLYADFLGAYAELASRYVLGDPRSAGTTLGPVVRPAAADRVRGHVREALAQGGRALLKPDPVASSQSGSLYVAPQVVAEATPAMRLMQEETFGPAVGIAPVSGDAEAIARINDSRFGLTASVWTQDMAAASAIGSALEVGTVYMNRCDYLDPALAWTGVKDSGRGHTLSVFGFDSFTRPKSFHLRR